MAQYTMHVTNIKRARSSSSESSKEPGVKDDTSNLTIRSGLSTQFRARLTSHGDLWPPARARIPLSLMIGKSASNAGFNTTSENDPERSHAPSDDAVLAHVVSTLRERRQQFVRECTGDDQRHPKRPNQTVSEPRKNRRRISPGHVEVGAEPAKPYHRGQ